MDRGQIDTSIRRRVLFIWEGAVATLPDYPVVQSLERWHRRLHRWGRAVDLWKISPDALKAMWTIYERSPLRIDLCVTTRGAGFSQAVADLATELNWPVSYVFCEAPADLGRLLPSMPDVQTVYYGLDEQRFAYGPQGVFFDPRAGQIV